MNTQKPIFCCVSVQLKFCTNNALEYINIHASIPVRFGWLKNGTLLNSMRCIEVYFPGIVWVQFCICSKYYFSEVHTKENCYFLSFFFFFCIFTRWSTVAETHHCCKLMKRCKQNVTTEVTDENKRNEPCCKLKMKRYRKQQQKWKYGYNLEN